MLKTALSWMFFILITASLQGQSDAYSILRERDFKGEALYGFMNGGSDLYLEYGFQELRALEIEYKDEEYSVEIYEMTTPEEAFGIYSLHTFKCVAADTIFGVDCHSRYQLQCVFDNYYISVVYQKLVSEVKNDGVALLKLLLNDYKFRVSVIDIPDELDYPFEKISGNIKYFKGKLGLNNGALDLVAYFDGLEPYSIWSFKTETGKTKVYATFDDKKQPRLLQERIPFDIQLLEEKNAVLFELP